MDINHIFIIVGNGWTKPQVIKDLEGEGYQDKFAFSIDNDKDINFYLIEKSNEVWTFGEVEGLIEYQVSKDLGKDCWRMG